MPDARSITPLLKELAGGERRAFDRLMPMVYAELRRIAEAQLMSERPDHTLQATALVHEVYARMVGQEQLDFNDRSHFLGVAAHTMRKILIDHARISQCGQARSRPGEGSHLRFGRCGPTPAISANCVGRRTHGARQAGRAEGAVDRAAVLRRADGLRIQRGGEHGCQSGAPPTGDGPSLAAAGTGQVRNRAIEWPRLSLRPVEIDRVDIGIVAAYRADGRVIRRQAGQ